MFTKILILVLAMSSVVFAQDEDKNVGYKTDAKGNKVKVVYPKKSKVDFEGLAIEGELKNPAEFYFQHRKQDKFDSLVKRRMNFHQEMLRDVVLVK
ncbi:MAG: hypothetical protein KA715_08580 [Xanthomonadaceae bacterium]|nr:hypothetical protein [Xanthomonadaceae bacterium]